MKKILLALSLFAVLFNFGCGRNSGDAGNAGGGGGKLVIAVIPKGTTHVYWQSIKAGAEDAAKEYNCDIRWNGPEREGDREREIQIVEDFIVQKVDGVVLAPLDHEALAPSVDKLAAMKIPCVIIDSDVATTNRVSFVATDNYLGGVMAGHRMGQILNGKGNVLVLKYAPGSASTTARENGFLDTIQKEFPGIKVVDTKFGQDTVETALQAAEDLLTRNQDVQGFFACNESTAVGTLRAILSQKREGIKFVGFDGSQALLDGVRAGQIDSLVVQNPYKMGYEGVKAVVMFIKGQPVEKRIDTGVALITRDNLDDPKSKELLRIP
jgi:ribose transport system substrate-binding protein